MHSEDSLPYFLRESWVYPGDDLPAVDTIVQVLTSEGRCTLAGLSSDGHWVEKILGVDIDTVEVAAWRKPVFKAYTFAWSRAGEPVGDPELLGDANFYYSGDAVSYRPGENLTVVTMNGSRWAREYAQRALAELVNDGVA